MKGINCPICGAELAVLDNKVCCTNSKCGFSFSRTINANDLLCENHIARIVNDGQLVLDDYPENSHGCNNPIRFYRSGKTVVRERKYTFLEGSCPICGAAMMVTSKGYACYNSVIGSSCSFKIPGILSHRKLSIHETEDFLASRDSILDGFSNEDGKVFSGVLRLNKEKNCVFVDTVVSSCPLCGGKVHVGKSFYACENYRNAQRCHFKVFREIAHHAVTVDELRQLCANGFTNEKISFFKEDGTTFRSKLSLSPIGNASFS